MSRDEGWERLARLARAASQGAPVARNERRARTRYLVKVTRRRVPLAGLVVAAALGACFVAGWRLLERAPVPRDPPAATAVVAEPRPVVPGPAGANDPAPLLGGSVLRFPEGTEFRFASGGRGRVLDSARGGARIVLEQGSLSARVVHRRDTVWRIEAGPFTVLVTGTAFRVAWDRATGAFDLVMTHGSVRVDGPSFSQRLGAGQALRATTVDGIVHLGPSRRARLGRATARRPPASERVMSGDAPSWSRRLSMGGFREVVDEAAAAGIDGVVARRGLDDLAALGTAARLAGETEMARRVLGALRARFPGTPAAAEAAFLLGRLADDVDRNRAAALAWYRRAFGEAPGGPLAAEALGRQLSALVASPLPEDHAAALTTARTYLARFPSGPHAARARSLVPGAPAARGAADLPGARE